MEELKVEVWKDIPNFEGLYQVSNLGNVKSLNRIINDRHKNIKGKLLKPNIANGYYKVVLSKNGKLKTIPIHKLVAQTFILNADNKPQINHIDGNKLNNNINNLEFVTAKENIRHRFDVLGQKQWTKKSKLKEQFNSVIYEVSN